MYTYMRTILRAGKPNDFDCSIHFIYMYGFMSSILSFCQYKIVNQVTQILHTGPLTISPTVPSQNETRPYLAAERQ